MNKNIMGGLAVVGLLLSGAANAVPCGFSGVAPSDACQNGTGILDSESLLNGGNYFGASNWTMLDRVGTNGDLADPDYWRVRGAVRGLPAGTFALASDIWDSYSMLAVALQSSRGAFPTDATASTSPVYWSLYQLIPGTYLYDWVYGATRSGYPRDVMNVSLYGIGGQAALAGVATTVAEPGSVALLLMAFTALLLASRRRTPADL